MIKEQCVPLVVSICFEPWYEYWICSNIKTSLGVLVSSEEMILDREITVTIW